MLKLFVGLSILIPTAAFAQTFVENTIPFPDYPDPTPWCRQTAAVGERLTPGGPIRHIDANNCIAEAQSNYNLAKWLWPRLTQFTAKTCSDRASASDVRGNPYSQWLALAACTSSLYPEQPLPPQVFTK